MKKKSKKREVVLSVFLSVAMVLTYMAAPMLPILGLQENMSSYAASYEGFSIYARYGGSEEWYYYDPFPATLVEGYEQQSWPFRFNPYKRSSYNEETGRYTYRRTDQYYKFEINGDYSDSFNLSGSIITSTNLPVSEDYVEEEEEYTNLYVSLNPGLSVGEYHCTLDIYYDSSGTATFEEPSASIPIDVTVMSPDGMFVLNVPEGGSIERSVDEGEFDGGVWERITFNSAISVSSSEESGESYDGKRPRDYLRFELSGEQANMFKIGGEGEDDIPYSIKEGENSFWIVSRDYLQPGVYHCTLNMYVDPYGTGSFQNSPQSIDITLTINKRPSNRITLPDLYWNNNEGDGRYLNLGNVGVKDLYIDPTKLEISGEDIDLFEVELAGETPVRVPANQSYSIAHIRPLIDGAALGEHTIQLHIDAEDGVAEAWSTASFYVGESPALISEPKSIDYGVIKPENITSDTREVTLRNEGDSPFLITGIDVPETGIFKATLPEAGASIDSNQTIEMTVSLDPESAEAQQNGVYEGAYVVHAVEAYRCYEWHEGEEEGYEEEVIKPVEDGQSVDLEIPVRVEISDEEYTLTIDAQGHGENIVLENLPRGATIYETASNAFRESFEGSEPVADGYVYGGLSKDTLSSYNNWDEYFEAQNALSEETITGDTTLYAIWFPALSDIDLTTESPACGASAVNAPPVINVPDGAKYNADDAVWMANAEDRTPYKGTFVNGQDYYYRAFVESEFPYAFSSDLNVTIDGDSFDASHSGRDVNGVDLWPYPTMKAVHSLEKVEAIEGSCTEAGSIEYYVCQGCGKKYADAAGTEEISDVVVPASGHSLVKAEAKPASCTEDGNIEHYTCEKCGKKYADAAGTEEVADVKVPATGHDWGEWTVVTAPTCSAEGIEERVCATDPTHKETRSIAVDNNAHVWGEWQVMKAATCGEKGIQYRTCETNSLHNEFAEIPALDHSLTKVDAKAATCSAEGNIEYYVCDNCGKLFADAEGETEITKDETVVAKTDHTWGEWTVTTAATCEADGVKTRTCSGCSTTETEAIPATGHDWGEWTTVTAPTCSAEGVEERVCTTDPAHKETRSIAADNSAHVWGEWQVMKAATCGEKGIKYRTCETNSLHNEFAEIPALDHSLTKIDAKASTCEEAGNIEYYVCDNCGKLFADAAGETEITKDDTIVAMTDHTWGEWTVTTAATCEADGVKTRTCSGCSATETEAIPATGHEWGEWTAVTAPTCSAEGVEERVCATDPAHKETRAIAADNSAHVWGEWQIMKAATCGEKGIKYRICETNSLHNEFAEIPALEHALTKVDAKAATCSAEGNIEYYVCENCGKLFADAEGETEITKDETVVAKTDHTWGEWTVTTAATCEADGVKTRTCSGCSATETEAIPATGHIWGEWTVVTAPTCSAEGVEERVCTTDPAHKETRSIAADNNAHVWGEWQIMKAATCGEKGIKYRTCETNSLHNEFAEIPALEHSLEKVEAKAATCSAEGNIEYYVCGNCGKLFADADGKTEITEADTIVAKTDHTWGEWTVTTAATCEADGVKTRTCSGCSATETEAIPATGHDWGEWTVVTAPTCSAAGVEERVCATDPAHKETRSIAANNDAHVWGEWQIMKAATCGEKGIKYRTCETNSLHNEFAEIPALEHALTKVEAKDATCEEAGNIEYYVCDNCGHKFTDASGTEEVIVVTVPATGHNWAGWTTVIEATASEEGLEERVCSNDPSHKETRAIPIDSGIHDWGEWNVLKTPTCSEVGVRYRICKDNAMHVQLAEIPVDPANHVHQSSIAAVKATPSANGKTAATVCDDCGAVLNAAEQIPRVGKMTLSTTSYTYNGSAKKPAVTIKDVDGNVISASNYTVSYQNNVAAATKDGKRADGSTAPAPAVKVTFKGGRYSGTLTEAFTIQPKAISTWTFPTIADKTYTGSALKPSFTLKDGTKTLVLDTDYTVAYSNNTRVGKAKVIITGKGNYTGTKTLYFKINPKGTNISSMTAASKGFTVKWTKQATQTTGYQIYYTTSTTAPKATTTPKATISKTGTVSKKVTGLKGGKKYYVYVRTYKTVDGVKYYSKWSAKKAVTTKK